MEETVFQSPRGIDWSGHVGRVNYGGDNLIVMFYNRPVPDPQKSAEAGRPIFKDVVYVCYHPPGERLNINDRPATREHQRRWPVQWQQFKENKLQENEGTPVDLLYPDRPSIAATLRASNVYTIEQLSTLSAHAIESIGMGAQSWVNAAVKYLEVADKGVSASKMRRELDERDSQIRTLNHKVELLTAEIERMRGTGQQNVADVAQLQALLASVMARPQIPPGGVGRAPIPQQFDAQTAQIDATRTSVVPARRGRRKSAA